MSPEALRAYPPCFAAESIPQPLVTPAQPQKQSAEEKAVSIYQDIAVHRSRYAMKKELCLFNKTQLLIAHDASGIGGAARGQRLLCAGTAACRPCPYMSSLASDST